MWLKVHTLNSTDRLTSYYSHNQKEKGIMELSKRVQEMQFSPIRKFNPIAQKAKEDGKKVYHLNIGQPDVETPACFMEASTKRLLHTQNQAE